MFKTILSIAAIGFALSSFEVKAQKSDLYPLINNGVLKANTTNGIANATDTATNTYNQPAGFTTASNTNLLLGNVAEFDNAGLTFGFTGTATSTNDLYIYKSFDKGATFEVNPSFSYTNIAPGAAFYGTNTSIALTGVTTLGFVVKNRGTTTSSNMVLELYLKSPKYGSKQSTL